MHARSMPSHHPSVDPRELDRAHRGWTTFVKFSGRAIMASIALLILMAIFLL